MGSKISSAIAKARAMQGSMAARLKAISDAYDQEIPDYVQALDQFVDRLRQAQAGAHSPEVGDVFPDFTLPDARGRLWNLDRWLAKGPLVLSFHRGTWCDFCQLNMQSLGEIEPRITALGGQILAVVAQKAGPNAAFDRDAASTFPILRDVGLGVSTMLGLTCLVGESLRHELEALQIDLDAANGGAGWLVPIPATFILNTDGQVIARHVDPDPRSRIEGEAIVQAAIACQSPARS